MKVLKDTFRPEMERIKRELAALQKLTVHVGIMGDAGSDLLMIAGVHEYGATIYPKNVKNLSIPLTKEAKEAGSPRKFDDLMWVPGHDPGVSFLVRPKRKKDRIHRQMPEKPDLGQKPQRHDGKRSKKKGGGEEFNSDDYEWLYMLVKKSVIPERSFIRASYDTGKSELESNCKRAIDGIIREGWTAQQAAEYVGTWAAEMTRKYLGALKSPPKADVTMKTTNSYALLTDTIGRIQSSITYRVEGGDGA